MDSLTLWYFKRVTKKVRCNRSNSLFIPKSLLSSFLCGIGTEVVTISRGQQSSPIYPETDYLDHMDCRDCLT
jgi:hypothetical protein